MRVLYMNKYSDYLFNKNYMVFNKYYIRSLNNLPKDEIDDVMNTTMVLYLRLK